MKKVIILLNAIGIVVSICMMLVCKDAKLFEVLAIFLMSMAYTIWQDKILRFGASLKWNYSYDIEPSKFSYAAAKIVSATLTIGGYLYCAHYSITLI